jgi:hypothetical protein
MSSTTCTKVSIPKTVFKIWSCGLRVWKKEMKFNTKVLHCANNEAYNEDSMADFIATDFS